MKTISVEIYNELTELGLKNMKAFTLDEILDMLPVEISPSYHLEFFRVKGEGRGHYKPVYNMHYYRADFLQPLVDFESTNPLEAAGKLLIWCIKNGHVKVEDLNNENN